MSQDFLSQWEPIIQEKARKYGVHPDLVRSIIWQESRGNPKATSGVGAQGLMQLMPGTAKDLGVKNAYDPVQNVDGGVRYLKQQIDKFGLTGGVAAYNAGPGNVQKHKGIPPFKETQDYVKKVLGKFSETFNPNTPAFTPTPPTQKPFLQQTIPEKKDHLNFLERLDSGELFDWKKEEPKKSLTTEQQLSLLSKRLDDEESKKWDLTSSKNITPMSQNNMFGLGVKPKEIDIHQILSPVPTKPMSDAETDWSSTVEDLKRGWAKYKDMPLLPESASNKIANFLSLGSSFLPEDSFLRKIDKGFSNSVANTITGLTTPKSIGIGASLLTPAAPYVLGVMTPGMVKSTYDVGRQGVEAIGEGDYERAAENLTSALTSAAMAYGGAKGAYKGIKADVTPYIPAIKEVFSPKGEAFGSGFGPVQQIFEGVKRAKEKGLFNPKAETPLQTETTIPESPQTLELQLNALKDGKAKAVLATPGSTLQNIPRGFSTLETDVGTWVYNPKEVSPYQIKKGIRQGTHGELLGYVEPKSANTTQIVSAIQNGVEAKSAITSPENAALQAAELQKQFPNAEIKTGGQELVSEVLKQRVENLPPGMKERGLITSIKESPNTPKQVSEAVQGRYDPITNRETMARAQEIVKADPIKAKDLVFSTKNPTAETNAVAIELMRQSNLNKDFSESIRIAEHVAKQATSQGQAIQAWAMYDKLGPEGLTKLAAQTVQKAREGLPAYKQKKIETKAQELAKQDGNQFPVETYLNKAAKELNQPHLDPSFVESIQQRALKLQELPEGSIARAKETALILRDISELVPPSFLRKMATFQTIAQLTNPKTINRNLVGNAIFTLAENVKDLVAAPIDRAVSVFTGQRTKSLGGGQMGAQIKGFANGLVQGAKEALQGIDLKNIADKWEVNVPSNGLPRGRTFKGKILGNIEKGMNVSLRAPDRAFYQAAFDKSVAEQMHIAKVSKPTPEMLVKANFEGLYKTFQDDSVLARVFSGMKRSMNVGKEFGVGDLLLKYPKTPGNILARSIDYSPAGFVKSAFEFGKFVLDKGFDQKNFVEATSRALVGTGLVYSGYKLAELGLLRNTENTKEGVRNLERSVGLNQSQLNVTGLLRYLSSGFDKEAARLKPGDQLVTYDWAVPASIPVSMGARSQERSKQLASKEGAPLDYLATASAGVEGALETMGDQPLIKTFTQLGQQRDFSKAITKSAEGIPASFTPTLFKQAAQYIDNTRRDTKGSNPLSTAKNLVLNKIPFSSKNLPEQVDVFGKPVEAYQNRSNNFFNVFLNPAFQNTYTPNKEAGLAYGLYKNSGETRVLPKVLETKERFHGVDLEISAEDRSKLQKWMGQRVAQAIREKSEDPSYSNSPQKKQVREISNIIADTKDEALSLYFKKMLREKPKNQRAVFLQQLFERNDLGESQRNYLKAISRDLILGGE